MMARRVAMPKLVALRAAQGKRQRDFSLRRATLSQERKRKKKSPCSVRSRKIIRDANDANDGGGEGARGIEGRPDVWSGLPVLGESEDGYLVAAAAAAWALAAS